VQLRRTHGGASRPAKPAHYRYQLQGPNASKVIESATGRPAPDLKFFNMCRLENRRPRGARVAQEWPAAGIRI